MPVDEWEKLPDGSLAVSHVIAWEAAAAPNVGVLHLRSATTRDQLDDGQLEVRQFALNAQQMREIGGALLKLAAKIETAETATWQ